MPTPSSEQRTKSVAPEGTLRSDLIGALLAAHHQLDEQLRALRQQGGDRQHDELIAECQARLAVLAALKEVVKSAKPAGLQAISATIHGAVRAAGETTHRSQEVTTAGAGREVALIDVSKAGLQRELQGFQTDFYDHRIFDRFLRFTSKEDEAAYRRREEENRRYIEAQMATKTPEGTLNGSGAAIDQMLDAHAHGAGQSRIFAVRWTLLMETSRRHRETILQMGGSTEEFDQRVTASVRRFLKAQGLSEQQISDRISEAPHPLEAVRPYVKTDDQLLSMMRGVDDKSSPIFDDGTSRMVMRRVPNKTPAEKTLTTNEAPVEKTLATKSSWFDSVVSSLRAAGVVPTDPDKTTSPATTSARNGAAQQQPGQVPPR